MSGKEKSSQESSRILLPLYDARRTSERRRSTETAAVNLRLVIERCSEIRQLSDSKAAIALFDASFSNEMHNSLSQNASVMGAINFRSDGVNISRLIWNSIFF